VRLGQEECFTRLRAADHGVLCTTASDGEIDVVPVCFAIADDLIVTPVDTVKPKSTTELTRVANVETRSAATLLCEHWDADNWSRLWWVRARLTWRETIVTADEDGVDAHPYAEALRAKYDAYRDVRSPFTRVLTFAVTGVVGWTASPPTA
jgi:PPOX class probable F420-dependent enzyme